MSTKYYKYTIHTDDAQKAIGEVQGHGVVVRTHTEGGVTHVYVTADKAAGHAAKHTAQEVQEADVLKIG